jgi:UDP-N-acetylmuramoylalanine--D-glutamate ligase
MRKNGEEEKIIDKNDIFIRGEHNVQNFMAAIGVTHDIAGNEAIKQVAENITGIEHRIEFVREVNGVSYYNSSVDSSPTRTIAALNSFDKENENNENEDEDENKKYKNIVVILGGYDKKIGFEPLVPVVSKKAKAAVLYGATKEKIRDAFETNPDGYENLELISADDFDSAVEKASKQAESGDIVLLSPACASLDSFKNFEARGNRFKEIVKKF